MLRTANFPQYAAWRHVDARDGFEVAFFAPASDGMRVNGHTVAIEARDAFSVTYAIEVDARWRTRWARITGWSAHGERTVVLQSAGDGRWRVDGEPAGHLDGCLDVDLESSALTNSFPVRRLSLEPGMAANAPAAYVRSFDLSVGRLEQRYTRIDDGSEAERYAYQAPVFDFSAELVYDRAGLVTDYPGIATRVATASVAPNDRQSPPAPTE